MTEKELSEQIERLTIVNKKLKAENKRLADKNAEYEKRIKVYENFINGGKNNG